MFSHIYCPDGLNIKSLFQGCILGAALEVGKASGIHIPRSREDVKGQSASNCHGPAQGSTGSHVLSVTSPNKERT